MIRESEVGEDADGEGSDAETDADASEARRDRVEVKIEIGTWARWEKLALSGKARFDWGM
jgi:hypothetical protein